MLRCGKSQLVKQLFKKEGQGGVKPRRGTSKFNMGDVQSNAAITTTEALVRIAANAGGAAPLKQHGADTIG